MTDSDSESGGHESHCPSDDANRPKRPKSDENKDGDLAETVATKYVILHTVLCPRSSAAHQHHPESACFLDTPSLDRGDSKATPLRGKHEIADLQSYLEDFPRISFVVERTYNCADFHDELEKSGKFRKIDIGPTGAQVAMQLRPYLFVLEADASQPEPTRETMSFPASEALKEALEFCLSEESISRNDLVAPYLQFYHARQLLTSGKRHLTPQWKIEIRALYAYLDERFGHEYAEADDLFSQGFFTTRHFLKLFGPGDVLVNTEKSDPVAMLAKRVLERQRSAITIECETWSFDGAFRKVERNVRISVPSKYHAHDMIPITSLDISPLHFNPRSLRDALQKRGEIFWKCRKPGLVSYNSPTKGFDIQVVSTRSFRLVGARHNKSAAETPMHD